MNLTVPRVEVLEAKARRYPNLDPVACEAYLVLRQVGECVRAILDRRLAGEGISRGRFMLLVVLDRTPDVPLSASDLAEQSGVTKQTVTSLLEGLEHDEYIARNQHQTDRRSTLVTLLPKGSQLLERVLPDIFRNQIKMMSPLAPDEQRLLSSLLRKVQCEAEEIRKSLPAKRSRKKRAREVAADSISPFGPTFHTVSSESV